MIEIVELAETENGERNWRMSWPEPDGSQGSFECESCELAVEYALFVRLLFAINQRRKYSVTVSDCLDGEGGQPSRNRKKTQERARSERRRTTGCGTAPR